MQLLSLNYAFYKRSRRNTKAVQTKASTGELVGNLTDVHTDLVEVLLTQREAVECLALQTGPCALAEEPGKLWTHLRAKQEEHSQHSFPSADHLCRHTLLSLRHILFTLKRQEESNVHCSTKFFLCISMFWNAITLNNYVKLRFPRG